MQSKKQSVSLRTYLDALRIDRLYVFYVLLLLVLFHDLVTHASLRNFNLSVLIISNSELLRIGNNSWKFHP